MAQLGVPRAGRPSSRCAYYPRHQPSRCPWPFLGRSRRTGTGTEPPDRGKRAGSVVRLLLSNLSGGRSVVLTTRDTPPRGFAAVFDLPAPGQIDAATAAQGNVRASPCANPLREGIHLGDVGTTRTNPRGKSRRCRNDSWRLCNATPLSGIDDASYHYGRHQGSRCQCRATGPASRANSAQCFVDGSGRWTHAPLRRARRGR